MNFNEAYKQLNQGQKQAVDKIDGTVMVIAGPGTGKTQVMGARVAKILLETDTLPSNILCLTFTESATVALRNRLYEFIGSEAHRVHIYTYHGFCNMVIQDHKDLFGIKGIEPISELEILELLKEIIDELPNGHVLKRYTGDEYYDSDNLKKLFEFLKRENISVDEVQKRIDDAKEDWLLEPTNYYSRKQGNYQKGDLKVEAQKVFIARMDKLLAAAQLLPVYNKKLVERRRYDFNDMILWVMDVFENNRDVLLSYQEQFHYFLVDEYQDTNGGQNDLLYKLIGYWDVPNVFVVGDDDQSIYKFQGANVENVRTFYESFKNHVSLITLTDNYRSSQKILDVSNFIIQKNEERLVGKIDGVEKLINAANPTFKEGTSPVCIFSHKTEDHEIVAIGNHILEKIRAGVNPNEIAILYKEHKQSDELVRFMESNGIPYGIVRSQDVFAQPLIQQFLQLLTYIHKESTNLNSGEHLLFEILHYTIFKNISSIDIARFSRFTYENKKKWREYILSSHDTIPNINSTAFYEIKSFIQDVEYWIKLSKNVSTQTFIERVLTKSGFMAEALTDANSPFQIQCFKTLFNFVKEETAKFPLSGLDRLLHQVELMHQNKLSLPVNDSVQGTNGVQFMTVYGSKGLEFEHVYLIGCVAKTWEKKKRAMPYGLSNILPGDVGHEEENRRLFYVAMTRAKKEMVISYAEASREGKSLNKTVYVVEAEESGFTNLMQSEVSTESHIAFFSKSLEWTKPDFQELTNQGFIQDILDNFRINATNLNSYLKCPVAFFYQNIIRVPGAKSESMAFGTAIHNTLETFFNEKTRNGVFGSDEDLVRLYQSNLAYSKESFTEESYQRKAFYGSALLKDYREYYLKKWEMVDEDITEVNIKNVEIDTIPIRGNIDKISIYKDSALVVDYKTGKFANGKKKVNPPTESESSDYQKVHGGDYWRQIVFYKILVDADPTVNWDVKSGIIDFVEPDEKGFHQQKIVISDEDIQFVRAQIKSVYQKIMNREFSEGCQEENCQWCNFQNSFLEKGKLKYENTNALDEYEMDQR